MKKITGAKIISVEDDGEFVVLELALKDYCFDFYYRTLRIEKSFFDKDHTKSTLTLKRIKRK